MGHDDDDGDGNVNGNGDGNDNDNGDGERSSDGRSRQIVFSLAQTKVRRLQSNRAISTSIRSVSSTFGEGVHGME
jgi:hypothetical protein